MSFLSRSPIGIAVSLKIFAARLCVRLRGLTQIDSNDAAGIALCNGLVQYDLGIAQIFRYPPAGNRFTAPQFSPQASPGGIQSSLYPLCECVYVSPRTSFGMLSFSSVLLAMVMH